MGYYIQYEQGSTRKIKIPDCISGFDSKSIFRIMIAIVFVFFVIMGAYYGDCFIPGDKEVTKAAFTDMVEELENGESMQNAITTFCREVLDGAELE